ncbi:MobA/MobL family protein, partial [Yersinia enterocolitica]|nr:MobA/MobL family protein [Yersinia enterocolitica]
MAIYSFQCKIVARTKRLNNAVAHAAYINRIDLDNNRDGTKWRYGHSNEDVYKSGVILPENADEKFSDPAYLWNEVEQKENRSNSRLARSFIISLPNELTPEQNKNLIEDYIKNHMASKGMIVNYAIHIDDTNNFHAHLMSTTRELDKSGLEFAKKNVIGRTWNDDDFLEGLRKGWADTANTHLARLDHQVRIDHRTLSAQRDEALEQFEMATTAEAKAEALAKAVSLDRPAIQRIWRSKLNTEEGRALREAQQDRRDVQLVVAEETKKSVLSLPQDIVLNNFAPKKIKSKTKTTIEKTRPAPEAVLKTADTGGEIKDLKYSSFNKFLLDIKIRYNKHQKNNATKRLNKKIDNIIKKIDKE